MELSNRQILRHELQNSPDHIVREVLHYLRFLKEKEYSTDQELEDSIQVGLEQSKNGEGCPHDEVMADLRKKFQ